MAVLVWKLSNVLELQSSVSVVQTHFEACYADYCFDADKSLRPITPPDMLQSWSVLPPKTASHQLLTL